MNFLRNQWYVAGFSEEVPPGQLFPRKILNEPVLFYRGTSGNAAAIEDRCPHRFAPLHLGKLKGDVVECGYHGLQFNCSGKCVHNPHGDGTIPKAAKVKSYPVVERFDILWIWMGDAEKADPAAIPHFESLNRARYTIVSGYVHSASHYELMTDNIMDLGHIEYLHPGLLGSEAVLDAKIEVLQDGDTVHSNRLTHNEILPPFLDQAFDTKGQAVDRWLNCRWNAPALMELDVGVTLTGRPHEEGRSIPTCHFMTPETELTTHYFWTHSRDYARDDEAMSAEIKKGFAYAFEMQDKPMINAQQLSMGTADLMSLKPVMLAGDAGAVRARRVLQQLLNAEQKSAAPHAP